MSEQDPALAEDRPDQETVQAAQRFLEANYVQNPHEAELMAINEDKHRDFIDDKLDSAQHHAEIAAMQPSNTFAPKLAKGYLEQAEQGVEGMKRAGDTISDDFHAVENLVALLRKRASLASTPDELAAQAKMEEAIKNAYLKYGLVNNETTHNEFLPINMITFTNDPEIRAAASYAAQAGDGHRTAEELRAFVEENVTPETV